MKWADFAPYVMPHVSGCPIPVLEHHAKLAAIDFLRRTSAYVRTLETAYTYGQQDVEIEEYDSTTTISRIMAVTVGGRNFDIVQPGEGMRLLRDESTAEFVFSMDLSTLTINPLQERRIPVVIDAALIPRLDASVLNDEVALMYAQDIACGAIASIQMLPGQKFSNPQLSVVHHNAFDNRITTVAAKAHRGHAASITRPARRYC